MIRHIVEPKRLVVSWQPPNLDALPRVRRIVALVERAGEEVAFSYLPGTPDYQEAVEAGFQGYPTFRLGTTRHTTGVLASLIRRVPPRNRSDFGAYLLSHQLPYPFPGTDLALLAYTGARLPGDSFEFFGDWISSSEDLELLMEVAGFRHQGIRRNLLNLGDEVNFVAEPNNVHDNCAIAIWHRAGRIGYVPRPLCASIASAMGHAEVSGRIARINGTEERPVISIIFEAVTVVPA